MDNTIIKLRGSKKEITNNIGGVSITETITYILTQCIAQLNIDKTLIQQFLSKLESLDKPLTSDGLLAMLNDKEMGVETLGIILKLSYVKENGTGENRSLEWQVSSEKLAKLLNDLYNSHEAKEYMDTLLGSIVAYKGHCGIKNKNNNHFELYPIDYGTRKTRGMILSEAPQIRQIIENNLAISHEVRQLFFAFGMYEIFDVIGPYLDDPNFRAILRTELNNGGRSETILTVADIISIICLENPSKDETTYGKNRHWDYWKNISEAIGSPTTQQDSKQIGDAYGLGSQILERYASKYENEPKYKELDAVWEIISQLYDEGEMPDKKEFDEKIELYERLNSTRNIVNYETYLKLQAMKKIAEYLGYDESLSVFYESEGEDFDGTIEKITKGVEVADNEALKELYRILSAEKTKSPEEINKQKEVDEKDGEGEKDLDDIWG